MLRPSISHSFNVAQSRLIIQTADLPLGTLADMVEVGAIDLQPGFQRRERWKVDKQSALIESFLLNVPVPPVYLSEESDGTYTAIDGKQRLKAINDFLYNRFSLRGLERLEEGSGSFFAELPSDIVNALRLRPFLRVVTLLKQTDPLLKYEVFLRLNRAGEPLNNQEIRNVAFRGHLNSAIYEASGESFLRNQLKIKDSSSSAYRDMADAEYVLRFLTLFDQTSSYTGNLSAAMDDFMRERQHVDRATADEIVDTFYLGLSRCEEVWGEHAFHRPEGSGWRDQLLAGLYDAQMIALAQLSEEDFTTLARKASYAIAAIRSLFTNSEFEKSVRTGTNTPARLNYRVQAISQTLRRIING